MYVHVIGWDTAKKDKIDLEGSKLKEKQGLYTCPPSSPQQLPFHCCLEVKEEQIKVQQPSAFILPYLHEVKLIGLYACAESYCHVQHSTPCYQQDVNTLQFAASN